ncbi:MAG: DUF1294 domain-containing protein [Lachnospiraceae bacterium]|nr:DUF1294 domain-containing protein [Lachnospiraceae bacterium]
MQPGFLILIYFAIVTLVAFVLMGIDKRKAKKGAFRIPEASLFLSALLGGSIGSVAGMLVFHHKTNHWYFQAFMPLITLLQVTALLTVLLIKTGLLQF